MFYEQRGGHIRVLPGAPAGTFFWQWQGEHLLSPTRQPDVPAVTGLIFHLARCGSTLLARLLAEDPNTLVLNEPDVLNTLLLAGMASDFVDPVPFADAVHQIAAHSAPHAKRVVIKTTSWNSVQCDLLRASFPAAQALFLTRDPADVLASLLSQPPGWANSSNEWLLGPNSFESPTSVTAFASALGKTIAAVELSVRNAPLTWRLTAYEDLPTSAPQCAEWLGADPQAVADGAAQVASRDSKTGLAWAPRDRPEGQFWSGGSGQYVDRMRSDLETIRHSLASQSIGSTS